MRYCQYISITLKVLSKVIKGRVLDVLYQSDDNYAMVSGISIVSLLENNQHLDKINIYYCDYKISEKNRNKLQTVINKYKNASLEFIDARPYHDILKGLNVLPWHGVYVTWLKLLAFGDLKIETDRVLFINGHTIINGTLDDLIDMDFDNNIMALSYDGLINNHKRTIGLRDNDGYYNCGIMLINHKKWLKNDISSFIKERLAEKSDYIIADQDLCNVVFRGQIKVLNSTYNFSSAFYAYDLKKFLKVNNLRPDYFYSYDELMENYYSPKIIHSLFGIAGKPWEFGNMHPQRFLWNKYIKMTPWANSERPIAKHTFNWFLYNNLPSSVFMCLYAVMIKNKFGK